MPRRRLASSGFVLLHALWVLATVGLLAALSMHTAARRAAETATSIALARIEALQEAAIEAVVFDLVAAGPRSRWAATPVAVGVLAIEDTALPVRVQPVDGLVDLASGDGALVASLLEPLLGARAGPVATRLAALRDGGSSAPRSYAQLQAAAGLSDEEFDCLYPFVTVHSGRGSPDAALSEGRVRRLLPAPGSHPPSAIEGPGRVAASTYRIEAGRPGEATAQARLSVEVTLTGLLDPPASTRSRQWAASGPSRCAAAGVSDGPP